MIGLDSDKVENGVRFPGGVLTFLKGCEMRLTAVGLLVTEKTSFDYKEGHSYTHLQGDDGQWYEITPGVEIDLPVSSVRMLESTDDSAIEIVEEE